MIGSIADLPFHEAPVRELLGLDVDRDEIDTDHTGYGWARAEHLWLADPAGARRVDDALVLAIHSADDGEAMPDDVELEFFLDDGSSVAALLSAFVARWLPRLPAASAVVLAMCNPHGAALRPLAPIPIHYGVGDVDAWLDPGDRIRLAAAAWRVAEAT